MYCKLCLPVAFSVVLCGTGIGTLEIKVGVIQLLIQRQKVIINANNISISRQQKKRPINAAITSDGVIVKPPRIEKPVYN